MIYPHSMIELRKRAPQADRSSCIHDHWAGDRTSGASEKVKRNTRSVNTVSTLSEAINNHGRDRENRLFALLASYGKRSLILALHDFTVITVTNMSYFLREPILGELGIPIPRSWKCGMAILRRVFTSDRLMCPKSRGQEVIATLRG